MILTDGMMLIKGMALIDGMLLKDGKDLHSQTASSSQMDWHSQTVRYLLTASRSQME